jgi:hypothetical protein
MPVQDPLLLVFCLVDDQLRALGLDSPRRRGPAPELADSEVITIELVGEFLGLDREARPFWHFRQHYPREFPALARVRRTTFARQAANLWRLRQLLQRHLAESLAGPAADWLVDGMPLPVCRFGRGGFCKGPRGLAAFGYGSLQKQTYYGFRLHLRASREGAILAYELAPANASDLAVLPELAPPPGTTGIGDRNYWSPQATADLAATGVRLLAPTRARSTTRARRGRGG